VEIDETAGQTHFEWVGRCESSWAVSVLVLPICCQPATSELSEPSLPRLSDLYSIECYSRVMSSRGDLLREVMLETSTTQSELSRVSGVHQPSISQFLSGKVELSDEQGLST
jgi:predicted XRE-type DNA-binding protein